MLNVSIYFFTVSTLTGTKRLVCSCARIIKKIRNLVFPPWMGRRAVPVLRHVFPVHEIVGARDAETKKARNFAK